MLTFPLLTSGVVTQYPTQKTQSYSNQVLSFLDGSEQRYRIATSLHRWLIRLELLAEAELNALEIFFAEAQGSFDDFAFPDPISAVTYPSCHLDSDTLECIYEGGLRGRTSVIVCENRGV